MSELWFVFVTGFLTGGITCVAVQGGLLTATVAARMKERGGVGGVVGIRDVGIFLLAKLLAHISLGAALGLAGSKVSFNPLTTGILQGLAGIYMLGVAAAMLDIHPFFRHFLIQTPKFMRKIIRHNSKSGSAFAPALLGAATIFIPCGTTQAMMVLAVTSGNPVWGAAILGTFVLGTTPLFVVLGFLLTKLGSLARQRFFKVAGAAVLVLALFSINSALVLSGSKVTGQRVISGIICYISYCAERNDQANLVPADEVTITFNNSGYSVDKEVVKAGSKIKLNLVNKGGYGCIQAFNLPKLGISRTVPPGSQETLELTVPIDGKELAFSCSMGMFEGQLRVIN
jgi:sulfite exporter TauE/SafE